MGRGFGPDDPVSEGNGLETSFYELVCFVFGEASFGTDRDNIGFALLYFADFFEISG